MIGAASILLLVLTGRIAGVSGIFGGVLVWRSAADVSWRLAFIGGLIVGAVLYRLFAGPLPVEIEAGTPVLVAAGLLVGAGTRLASGCTSGHGVCGIARRSPRSFVATLTFMGVAMLTVHVVRHVVR
jgi:uncharacterized membrane protein YedE/YeeE